MPEGGAGVIGCGGNDLDQPGFRKPVHIGPSPIGTSVLVQTWVFEPSEHRIRALEAAPPGSTFDRGKGGG